MKFLTDENVSLSVVRMLRSLGHDVKDIKEADLAGVEDEEIITLGLREGRVIITHDKDFGNLLTFPLREHSGVILLRLHHPTPENACAALNRVLASVPEGKLLGALTVVDEVRIRVRERPRRKEGQ